MAEKVFSRSQPPMGERAGPYSFFFCWSRKSIYPCTVPPALLSLGSCLRLPARLRSKQSTQLQAVCCYEWRFRI